MPCAQQHDAHKGAPHAELIGNFVITHVRVIAQHQSHSGAGPQLVQGLPHFLCCLLVDQLVQLVGVRVVQRDILDIIGLFVLADFAAPQDIPAMVGSHPVEPCGKGARLVVLAQLVPQLHEYLHSGIFGVFPGWQSPSAKAEDSRGKIPVKLTPSIGIPCTSPGNCLRGLRHSRHAHGAWSQRFHRLVRREAPKTYTILTNSNNAVGGYLVSAQHSTRSVAMDHGWVQYQAAGGGEASLWAITGPSLHSRWQGWDRGYASVIKPWSSLA